MGGAQDGSADITHRTDKPRRPRPQIAAGKVAILFTRRRLLNLTSYEARTQLRQ